MVPCGAPKRAADPQSNSTAELSHPSKCMKAGKNTRDCRRTLGGWTRYVSHHPETHHNWTERLRPMHRHELFQRIPAERRTFSHLDRPPARMHINPRELRSILVINWAGSSHPTISYSTRLSTQLAPPDASLTRHSPSAAARLTPRDDRNTR